MTTELAKRARELALMLTQWPSVTGSPDEAALPKKLVERLRFDRQWTEAIPCDAAGRSNVLH